MFKCGKIVKIMSIFIGKGNEIVEWNWLLLPMHTHTHLQFLLQPCHFAHFSRASYRQIRHTTKSQALSLSAYVFFIRLLFSPPRRRVFESFSKHFSLLHTQRAVRAHFISVLRSFYSKLFFVLSLLLLLCARSFCSLRSRSYTIL